MRIVGGLHRGRILSSPSGQTTRPTGDRVREAVFNILGHASWRMEETRDVIDVFSGTGALGLEALSRGASHVVFVEQDAAALAACKKNIAAMRIEDSVTVLRLNALKPGKLPVHIAQRNLAFFDPPYGQNLGIKALDALDLAGWIAPGATCVMEMAKKNPEPLPEGWVLQDERTYGVALIRFLTRG